MHAPTRVCSTAAHRWASAKECAPARDSNAPAHKIARHDDGNGRLSFLLKKSNSLSFFFKEESMGSTTSRRQQDVRDRRKKNFFEIQSYGFPCYKSAEHNLLHRDAIPRCCAQEKLAAAFIQGHTSSHAPKNSSNQRTPLSLCKANENKLPSQFSSNNETQSGGGELTAMSKVCSTKEAPLWLSVSPLLWRYPYPRLERGGSAECTIFRHGMVFLRGLRN